MRSPFREGGSADDDELLERSKAGDMDAYGELVTRYQAVAQRTAYVITRDSGASEEAAQEAFVKAYRALGRFRSGAPFRPWLLRIVANEALNRRKAAARRPTVDLDAVAAHVASDPQASPEERALAAERRSRVRHALEALREEDRVIIAYRYFLELSEAEMATALDCAPGTVKSRLSRALARLRERIDAE